MFIVPISSSIRPVESYFDNDAAAAAVSDSTDRPQFSDVFKEIFTEVQETQRVVQEDSVKLTLGEIDDLHTIYNNMTKAAVAVDTFVAVKDAAINAYDRILQISM
ncbi:MAG: flagellar hook-basal body complex protein FliE [Oscillospiraceae bacterium]|nr:flagellar hook-basal body complex protein FliE [Oscillospiraceae bacterium]